jgi:hypothetical protein
MKLEQAKEILSRANRYELRDHAFGDTEISWVIDDKQIADGYFNGIDDYVSVRGYFPNIPTTFKNNEAHQLRDCGASVSIERNDETGPSQYQEGVIMPGLTSEGVRQELFGE